MPDEAAQRAAVVRIAREWLGTPYHDMGRLKGIGCDCLTLIVEVYEEAGMIPHMEIPAYSPQFALHSSEEKFVEMLLGFGHEVTSPGAGDVVLFRHGRCFGHGAIVVAWPTIIHAYMRTLPVMLADASNEGALLGRTKRFFSIWPRGVGR